MQTSISTLICPVPKNRFNCSTRRFKVQKQMEVLTLKKENERLRRFVDSIPPEMRRILREQQRQQRPKDHDL